jgi:hypothetical protein
MAARFALVDGTGQVDNVIKADTAEIAQTIAALRGQTAREVVTELEEPITPDAICTRECEPGATYEERAATSRELELAADKSELGGEELIAARSTTDGVRKLFTRGA